MNQPPQGESIWGTINTCTEIALNIYMIIAQMCIRDRNRVVKQPTETPYRQSLYPC